MVPNSMEANFKVGERERERGGGGEREREREREKEIGNCNFTNFRCTFIFGTFGASVSYLNFNTPNKD